MNYFTSSYINSSIAQLATRYVGQYLDGIEPEKFEVAWKGGNLQLNDVRIRQEVVDLIGLPVTLVYGWVGNVKISLPIGNLFSIRASAVSEPLIIELEELYVVVAPKPEAQWDETVLLERYRLSRQRMLDEADVKLLAAQAQKQLETTAKARQGWMARIASRFVEDIRFNIRSVHIRYESPCRDPSSGQVPFCFGMTLESLLIRTPTVDDINFLNHNKTDRRKVESPHDASGQKKILRISEVAVYWNSNYQGPLLVDQLLNSPQTPEQRRLIKLSMHDIMLFAKSSAPLHSSSVPSYHQNYVLKPFSCSVLVNASAVMKTETPASWRKPRGHTFIAALPEAVDDSSKEVPSSPAQQPNVSQYNLRVDLASLDVSFNKNAFSDLSTVTSTFSIYKALAVNLADQFELCLPYRPQLPVRGNAKIWWKYAVGCIVRRLRQEFPYAFRDEDSIWDWGSNLKTARIAQWKMEYRALLTKFFHETALAGDTGPSKPPSPNSAELRKDLTYLQQVLPKKEMLEVYIETRQHYLGLIHDPPRANRTPSLELPKHVAEPSTSWSQWFGLTPARYPRPDEVFLGKQEFETHASETSSDAFFDVDEDEERKEMTVEETGTEQVLDNAEEYADIEEFSPRIAFSTLECSQPSSKNLVDSLLAADAVVVEALVELEAASIQLVTSTYAKLIGSVESLNLGIRIDQALTAKIALQDLSMRYEVQGVSAQKILTRQAQEKQLLVLYFCSKEPKFAVPSLFVDVQHVTFSFLPAVLGAAVNFFKTADSLGYQDDDVIYESHSPQLVTADKLSMAKRLLYDDYRNALIDLFIAAPTIIIPTVGSSPFDNQIECPVFVAHLGSLTICSEKASLPPTESNPFHPGKIITYSSLQRFRVQLSEIHVDQFTSYDQAVSRRSKGFSVQTDMFVTQDKNVLKTLLGSSHPKDAQSPTGAEGQSIPKAGVDVRGDLPALAIYLNRKVFDSLIAAIAVVSAPLPIPTDDINKPYAPSDGQAGCDVSTHPQLLENSIAFSHSIAQLKPERRRQTVARQETKHHQLHLTQSQTQADPIVKQSPIHRRSVSPVQKSKITQFSEVLSAAVSQTEIQDGVKDAWPPDLRARFSLVRFELSIDCLSSSNDDPNAGVIQLITDSMSVGFCTRPGVTSIDFCLGELTLSKPADISAYQYILRTEEQTTTNRKPLQEHTSLEENRSLEENTDSTNFISVKLTFADQQWSKQKYCGGASTFLDATFRRYLWILFQPTPLREFILFWMSGEVSSYDVPFETQITQPLDVPIEDPSLTIKSRSDDLPTTIVRVSVLGVSCTFVEDPSQSIFAICEFESAVVDLSLRKFGSDFGCTLKNLLITDLSAQDGIQRRLFGVIPGEKYLLSISTSTTDPLAPFFDGYSLDLRVDIGRVEVLCFVDKLLRIFYWIFDGLLDTVTVAPPIVASSKGSLEHDDTKETQSVGSCVDDGGISRAASSWLHRHISLSPVAPLNRWATSASVISEHLRPQSSRLGRFRNEGEKLLARWLMRSASCKPRLSEEECRYLEQRCGYQLPEHQQRKAPLSPDFSDSLQPPLILRKYVINFLKPSIILPVSASDPQHARLTVDSITITNSPSLSNSYGLMDDIEIRLNDVTIQQGNLEAFLLSGVNIDVHFLRASLNVTPHPPTWMQFGFSDVPWFMTPERLSLVLAILNQNILGDDPDIIASRKKSQPVINSPLPSRQASIAVDVSRTAEHQLALLAYQPQEDKTEEVLEATDRTEEEVRFTSLFQFSLPGLFVFMTPNQTKQRQSATACFHADILQCGISKNTDGVLSILISAKSARLLHCQGDSSPYRVILSDSRQNLSDVYRQEILALQRQVLNHGSTGGFPADIHTYLKRMKDELGHEFREEMTSTPYKTNDTFKSPPSDFISDELRIESRVEDLSCLYRAQPGQKDLCVKVYDPRLIVSRPYVNDLIAFFSGESEQVVTTPSHSQSPSDFSFTVGESQTTEIFTGDEFRDASSEAVEELNEIEVGQEDISVEEVSFHMRVELSNASLIFPLSLDDSEASLLIMRGTFQGGQTKVTNCSEPVVGEFDLNGTVQSNELSQRVEDLSPLKSTVTQSLHYSLSVTQVEIFVCDLKTLSSIELFEHNWRSSTAPQSVTSGITRPRVSSQTIKPVQRLSSNHLKPNETPEPNSPKTTMPHAFLIAARTRDTLAIQPFVNEMAIFLLSSQPSPGSSSNDLVRSASSFTQTVVPRPLPLKNLLGLSNSPDSASLNYTELPHFQKEMGRKPDVMSTPNFPPDFSSEEVHFGSSSLWEDLVRLMCPNVEFTIDMTDRTVQDYNWSTHTLSDTELHEPNRTIVSSVQPISVEVSYMDIIFLRRCLENLNPPVDDAQQPVTPIETPAPQNTTPLHRITKVDADFAEMKCLVLNDSSEFSSAPFLEVTINGGSLSFQSETDLLSRRSELDVLLVVALRFFNPRAVAFEPIIENSKFRFVYSSADVMTPTDDTSLQLFRNLVDILISGSKTEPLCINVSHVLLASLLQNYQKWVNRFGLSSDITPNKSSLSCVDAKVSEISPTSVDDQSKSSIKLKERNASSSGMFRFTPYSVRNETGMNLLVSIPSDRSTRPPRSVHRASRGKSEIDMRSSILRPNEIYRLKQLQVDIRSQGQQNFKIQIQLSDPSSQEFYPLDGLVPVERLGLYLYRPIDLSSLNDDNSSLASSNRSSPSFLSKQFLICRVRVADGQKQLTIQSKVLLHNDLSEHIGLEVIVDLSDKIIGCVEDRPRLIIPPMSCCAVPIFACSSGALSFRPVIWTKSLNSSQPLILESRLKSKEFPDPHFSWSKSIQLNDIWSRVGVIEHEAANVEIAESKDPTLFVSGLPRFLPIEIIRCFPLPSGRTGSADFDRSSSNKMKDRSEDAFYMAVVTEWTTCVHRNRSTQQLTISVKPPFRIRSTVPMPISSGSPSIVPRLPTTSISSGHALSRLGTLRAKIPSLEFRSHKTHATVLLNSDIRLFSLPLLDSATIRINPFHRRPGPPPIEVFSRLFPQNSLMEGVDAKHWREFWISEGSPPRLIPKIQMVRVSDHENRSFRLQVITESQPGRPVEVLIHAPVWFVCHIGIGRCLPPSCPLAFSYNCSDQEPPPTPEPSKIESQQNCRSAHCSWVPSFAGKALVAPCSSTGLEVIEKRKRKETETNLIDVCEVTEELIKSGRRDSSHQRHSYTPTLGRDCLPFNHKSSPNLQSFETSQNPFAIDHISPWSAPLDCNVTSIRVLCGGFESADVMINDMQEDQMTPIRTPVMPKRQPEPVESSQTTFGFLTPNAQTANDPVMRSSDLCVRISDCSLSLPRSVKLVTLAHRYYIQNESTTGFQFHQCESPVFFNLPIGAMIPIEWTAADSPTVFSLRPSGSDWQWGGRLSPDLIENGGDFIYHFAPDRLSAAPHFNVRIEKHPPLSTDKPYASIILRIRNDSPDLPDAIQIVNHTPFLLAIRQYRSPATHAFTLQVGETLNFAWDDNTLEQIIFLFPDNSYYKTGAVIKMDDLSSGESQVVKFEEAMCKYWFTVLATRAGTLRLLHIHQYDQAPQFHLNRAPTLAYQAFSNPDVPQLKVTSADTPIGSITPAVESIEFRENFRPADWSKVRTSQLFENTCPILHDSTLSVLVKLPAIYLSIIADLPRSHTSVQDGGTETISDVLRRRGQTTNLKTMTDAPVPSEFVVLYLDDLKCRYISSASEDLIGLTIGDIQIDNQQPTATFPIFLQRLGLSSSTTLRRYEARQLLSDVDLMIDLERHSLLDILIKRNLTNDTFDVEGSNLIMTTESSKIASTGNITHVEIARVILLGLIIKTDMGFITSALTVYSTYSEALNSAQPIRRLKKSSSSPNVDGGTDSEGGSQTLRMSDILIDIGVGETFVPVSVQFAEVESSQKLYFERFLIHPLLLRLSVSPASPISLSSESMSFIGRFFASIGSIQDVPISFTSFRLRDEAKVISALASLLKAAYSSQFWKQSYVLATSVDLLGNPLATFSHLSAGIGDLVADPVTSMSDTTGTGTVFDGFGKGAKSFWDNTVYGAFNVVSKVSGAAAQVRWKSVAPEQVIIYSSQGLGVLAMDDEYVRERQQQVGRRKPKDAAEGFSLGAEALGRAFAGGLRGLVAEPTRGIEENGFEGLIQGFGKGVVGALVKPVAGVFEATALAAGGIQEEAGESSGVARGRRERRRLPRVFYGPDRLIKNYSATDAMINDALIFVPGLDWNNHTVDAILYDEQLQYLSITNDDELLTAFLTPAPRPDIYCDLWNIAECEAVIPDDITVMTLNTKSPRRTSRITNTQIGGMHANTHRTPNFSQPSRVCGFVGVALKFHEPPSTKSIRTSTRELARSLAALVNEKLAKI